MISEKKIPGKQWWAAFIVIATIEVVLLIKLLTNQPSLELLIPIVVIAVFMGLMLRIEDIRSLSLTQEGIKTELSTIRNELSEAQKTIEENKNRIDNLFLFSMSDVMYENLKKLLNNDFRNYQKTEGLERELQYLRMIDYIAMRDDHHLREIPVNGENLNLADYIQVTRTGKEFVALREAVEQEKIKNL
jgi:hypothetical protein